MANENLDFISNILEQTEKKNTIPGQLGVLPGSTAASVFNVIGTVLEGTGLLLAYNSSQKNKSYASVVKPQTLNVENTYNDFLANAANISSGFESALSTNTARMSNDIRMDLVARGINDDKVSASSVGQFQASTSGAYAAARAALESAKVNATNALESTQGRYYQNLAQKNLESVIANRAQKAGIWGAIGGVVGKTAIDIFKVKDQAPQSDSDTTPEPIPQPTSGEAPESDKYANPDMKEEQ